jgi:hypothetical protein
MAPAALWMLSCGCATTENGLASANPQEAHDRGVAFLVGAQNDDGSWGSFASARPGEIYLDNLSSHRAFRDATSALCLMALQEPSATDARAAKALERGVDFLLAAPPTGRASGGTFYDTWAHTYLVQAFSRLHGDERFVSRRQQIAALVNRELGLLEQRQGLEGGWGYYDFNYTLASPSGDMSTSFNTAAVLIALDDARRAGFDVKPEVVSSGLQCLERLRLPSGAYVYGTYAQMRPQAGYNLVKGSLGRSQSCNLALWLHQREISPPQLREGLANLRDEHHFIEIGKGRPYPHEAWYFTAGYYFMFGHYYASGVVTQLEGSDRTEFARWLQETMVRLQDPDGSWFDFPLYGYHKCYGTAFGLLALQQVRPLLDQR